MKHFLSAARGRIHVIPKVMHALCNRTGVLQKTEQCFSAKLHRAVYKNRHFGLTWTSRSLRSSGVRSSWRSSLQMKTIGLGINGMLVACPTTIPNGCHWEKPVSGWRDILWHFEFPRKFLYCFRITQKDIPVNTVLLLAENSGLAVLRFHCSKCTWSKDECLLSVFVSSAVFSGIATGRSLVHEFARDVHRQDL